MLLAALLPAAHSRETGDPGVLSEARLVQKKPGSPLSQG